MRSGNNRVRKCLEELDGNGSFRRRTIRVKEIDERYEYYYSRVRLLTD